MTNLVMISSSVLTDRWILCFLFVRLIRVAVSSIDMEIVTIGR